MNPLFVFFATKLLCLQRSVGASVFVSLYVHFVFLLACEHVFVSLPVHVTFVFMHIVYVSVFICLSFCISTCAMHVVLSSKGNSLMILNLCLCKLYTYVYKNSFACVFIYLPAHAVLSSKGNSLMIRSSSASCNKSAPSVSYQIHPIRQIRSNE